MTDSISFASVEDAVRWSEEVATMPDIKSCLGNLLRRSQGGTLSKADIIDIAQTVSLITASSKPFKGLMLKSIYGGRAENDRVLAIMLASKMRSMDCAKHKNHFQLVLLGHTVIKSVRAMELYGDRYPVRRMAQEVGVSRETFRRSKAWPQLTLEATSIIMGLLEQGISEVYTDLNELGWIK